MGRKRLLTPEQETKVVQRYQNGESSRRIAADIRVSSQTILNSLRRNGIAIRIYTWDPCVNPRTLTLEQEAEIICRYKAGESGRQIAADYPVSHETAYKAIRRGAEEVLSRGGKQG